MRKVRYAFIIVAALLVALFVLNIYMGSVRIPWREVSAVVFGGEGSDPAIRFIVVESRLPQAVTALLAGAALAVSGLMLQTSLRNPLAGPSILGISAGAGLGVAVVMLLFGGSVALGSISVGGRTAVLLGALAGSLLIMALLLLLSSWLRNTLMLLIAGIMLGYLTSSLITLLNFSSTAEGVHGYTIWGMGSFNSVSMRQMPLFASVSLAGLALSVMLIKPLNLMILGDNYARNLGLNLTRTRNLLLFATGVLTAVATAYCGPVSFIGLAVPHIARIIFRRDDHRVLLPATIVLGGAVALLCNLICVAPSDSMLPLNAVTPLIGAPVIIYVIVKRR